MGLFLTKEEKSKVRDALGVEIPCRSYLGANLDLSYMAEIFSESPNRDDVFIKDAMKVIDLWIGAFPRGGNIPNPSAHAARLYELLCEDNGLTYLGMKMVLDNAIQTRKQVPSIAEISAEIESVKQKYLTFKFSYEQFMRAYKEVEQSLVKQITDARIAVALSDILDFPKLIDAWHHLCDGYPFPGCDIAMHPYKRDKDAGLILAALSKPRHDNPLLVLFVSMIKISEKFNNSGYDSCELYQEIKNLWQKTPFTIGPKDMDYIPFLFDDIIDPKKSENAVVKYLKNVAQEHFKFEEMFE